MCFVPIDDYDWIAEVAEEYTEPAPRMTRCHECGQFIHAGETRHVRFMQEHEECRFCELDPEEAWPDHDPEADGPYPTHDCTAGGCRFGETDTDYWCERCERVREAIRKVELAAGCVGDETVPERGGMDSAVRNGDGWLHYIDGMTALGLHAEAELAWRLFGYDEAHAHPDDLYESLAFERTVGHGWFWKRDGRKPGEYPNAFCLTHSGEPLTDFDALGGEG